MSSIEKIPQKNTHKNTKKTPYEKGEFVEFVKNEKKREDEKNFKIILKDYPEIYKLIEEREIFFEENILLGEKIESLNLKIKNYENKGIEKLIFENKSLINENQNLKNTLIELKKRAEEILQEQENKIKVLQNENIKLKNENEAKRNVFGFVKDKSMLSFYKSENKELKEKLNKVGRLSITDGQIKRIIELHKEGLGYEKISQKVGVSKSTACKYVKRFLDGKLDLSI